MSSKAAARRKKKAAHGQQEPQAATTPETAPMHASGANIGQTGAMQAKGGAQ